MFLREIIVLTLASVSLVSAFNNRLYRPRQPLFDCECKSGFSGVCCVPDGSADPGEPSQCPQMIRENNIQVHYLRTLYQV